MRTRHWCALCRSTPTVPDRARHRGERQAVAVCLKPLHSLAFAAPSTWSSSPGKGEEEGDLPAGIGLHIYPSSTLYPQDPYNQGTKADAPVWKKNSLTVIVSQWNPQSQSSLARRFLFVKTGRNPQADWQVHMAKLTSVFHTYCMW